MEVEVGQRCVVGDEVKPALGCAAAGLWLWLSGMKGADHDAMMKATGGKREEVKGSRPGRWRQMKAE
jgi:hypothetical protein